MPTIPAEERRRRERLTRDEIAAWQLERLNALLDGVLPHNEFYARKLAGVRRPLRSLDELAELPFTFKEELHGANGRMAANLTWPAERYVRFHQTSGTRGRPMSLLDTAEDWQWWLDGWQFVLDAAGIAAGDRLLMAFSFGPFIGFWTAFDAATQRGCLVVPTGGMNTLSRLDLIRTSGATGVFCTPSYAMHMAEVAAEHKIDSAHLGVRSLVLAGEPGGSIASTRARLEQAWGARVTDHAGATEVGPWGYGDAAGRGLYVLETEFIAEFLSIASGEPAADGELAELVLTSLGRWGAPVVRYRTRDLVRAWHDHGGECSFVLLEGGVLGRNDDMIVVRGVNIFPSAIEQIIHSFPEVVEYRVIVTQVAAMDQLRVEVEDRLDHPARVAEELQLRLGLKVDVGCVPLRSLPRNEGKGRRFEDRR